MVNKADSDSIQFLRIGLLVITCSELTLVIRWSLPVCEPMVAKRHLVL